MDDVKYIRLEHVDNHVYDKISCEYGKLVDLKNMRIYFSSHDPEADIEKIFLLLHDSSIVFEMSKKQRVMIKNIKKHRKDTEVSFRGMNMKKVDPLLSGLIVPAFGSFSGSCQLKIIFSGHVERVELEYPLVVAPEWVFSAIKNKVVFKIPSKTWQHGRCKTFTPEEQKKTMFEVEVPSLFPPLYTVMEIKDEAGNPLKLESLMILRKKYISNGRGGLIMCDYIESLTHEDVIEKHKKQDPDYEFRGTYKIDLSEPPLFTPKYRIFSFRFSCSGGIPSSVLISSKIKCKLIHNGLILCYSAVDNHPGLPCLDLNKTVPVNQKVGVLSHDPKFIIGGHQNSSGIGEY